MLLTKLWIGIGVSRRPLSTGNGVCTGTAERKYGAYVCLDFNFNECGRHQIPFIIHSVSILYIISIERAPVSMF
jgi:hypothetical protein